MTKWALFVVLLNTWNGGITTVREEFWTQKQCQTAADAFTSVLTQRPDVNKRIRYATACLEKAR